MAYTRANLAINASGEQTFNTAWTASNGTIITGYQGGTSTTDETLTSSDSSNAQLSSSQSDLDVLTSSTSASTVTVTPYVGSAVVRYSVTTQSGQSYRASPGGPDDAVHRGAFKIDSTTNSVAGSVMVQASIPVWVQPMARLLTTSSAGFSEVATINLGLPVLVSTSGWTEVRRSQSVITTATHWLYDIAVYASDPRVDPAAPAVGTVLFFDAAYIPETGVFINSSDIYFDGNSSGSYWGGVANNSISYFGTQDTSNPEDPGSGTGTEPPPGSGEDDDSPTPDEEPLPVPPPPPVVVPPGDPTDETYIPDLEPVPVAKQAERILARASASGICLNEDVQIANLVLNKLDETGVLWIVTNIEGWWTLPEPDIPDYPRGLDDGSYETRGRYNARVFTLSGSFFPSAPSQVREARAKLIENVNLCHRGAWFVTHETDETRGSQVWLSGQPQIETVNVSGRTDFSIGLKAPDPVKYGLKNRTLPGWHSVSLTSQNYENPDFGRDYDRTYPWSYPTDASGGELPNEGSVINQGNTRVFPIIRINGPTGGRISIRNFTTGQVTRVAKNLYAHDELVINCQNKSVTLNGAPNQRFYLDLLSDWLYVDPGDNKIFWFDEESTSSGSVTIDWRPGWIG